MKTPRKGQGKKAEFGGDIFFKIKLFRGGGPRLDGDRHPPLKVESFHLLQCFDAITDDGRKTKL